MVFNKIIYDNIKCNREFVLIIIFIPVENIFYRSIFKNVFGLLFFSIKRTDRWSRTEDANPSSLTT